jgi:hypothetical protein
MSKNQFTVDLGKLSLTDDQARSINAAIHAAVAKELGGISVGNKLALVPIFKNPHGPIINGIIAWEGENILAQAFKQVEG